jgi:hypothetical protein
MRQKLAHLTLALSGAALVFAVAACKRKKDEPPAPLTPPPSAAVIAPAMPPPAPAPAPVPQLGEVKRYTDKEKEATGAVKVLENDVKVYDETDDKTLDVAKLPKDLLVFRLATIEPDWALVEFPSGVGKVSPGWVQTKYLSSQADNKVKRDSVAKQAKAAAVTTNPATASSAVATGSAQPASSAAAAPADTATAAATTTASAATTAAATTTATATATAAATTTATRTTTATKAPSTVTTAQSNAINQAIKNATTKH